MFSRFIKKLTDPSQEKEVSVRQPVSSPDKKMSHRQGISIVRDFFKERKGLAFLILALVLLVVSTQVRSVVFVVLFIIVAALSKLTQLLLPPSMPIGTDLVSVLLVVLTVAYGPFVGISAALVAYYAGNALLSLRGRRTDPAVYIIPPLAYVITGIAVSMLSYGFPGIGYTSIFVYAGAVTIMFALYYGASGLTAFFTFLSTYIPFHFWIYSAYGTALANLFI